MNLINICLFCGIAGNLLSSAMSLTECESNKGRTLIMIRMLSTLIANSVFLAILYDIDITIKWRMLSEYLVICTNIFTMCFNRPKDEMIRMVMLSLYLTSSGYLLWVEGIGIEIISMSLIGAMIAFMTRLISNLVEYKSLSGGK